MHFLSTKGYLNTTIFQSAARLDQRTLLLTDRIIGFEKNPATNPSNLTCSMQRNARQRNAAPSSFIFSHGELPEFRIWNTKKTCLGAFDGCKTSRWYDENAFPKGSDLVGRGPTSWLIMKISIYSYGTRRALPLWTYAEEWR